MTSKLNWKQQSTPGVIATVLKSKKIVVDKRRIREWEKSKDSLLSLRMIYQGIKRKGLDGAGRKPLDDLMEEVLVEWIYKRREKRL